MTVPSEHAVDRALTKIGTGWSGKWQILMYLLLCLSFNSSGTWQMLNFVFIGGEPDRYHCDVPDNSSLKDTIPMETENNKEVYSKCLMYNDTDTNLTIACTNGWEYDTKIGPTVLTEWNLVCDRNHLAETSQVVFNFGVLVGALVFPPLSDRFGRKTVHIVCQISLVAVGVATAFSVNYLMFVSLRFIGGTLRDGQGISGISWACELFPASGRAVAGTVMQYGWSLSYLLLALFAYFIRDWRVLQLTISVIPIFVVSYIWLVPESIQWLCANGRTEEAEKILKKAAKFNQISSHHNFLEDPAEDALYGGTHEDETKTTNTFQKEENDIIKYSILDFCSSKILGTYTIINCLIWFVDILVYYGLSLSTSLLAGDRYFNFFLGGLVEIPAYFMATVTVQKFGRKWPMFIPRIFGCICLIALITVPDKEEFAWLKITLAMVGKFGATTALAVLILVSNEIFPTNLRSTGFGLSASVGRIGGMLAPFSLYMAKYVPWAPNMIFGILGLVVSMLGLLLPETKGKALPLTIQDVEKWDSPISRFMQESKENNDDEDDIPTFDTVSSL